MIAWTSEALVLVFRSLYCCMDDFSTCLVYCHVYMWSVSLHRCIVALDMRKGSLQNQKFAGLQICEVFLRTTVLNLSVLGASFGMWFENVSFQKWKATVWNLSALGASFGMWFEKVSFQKWKAAAWWCRLSFASYGEISAITELWTFDTQQMQENRVIVWFRFINIFKLFVCAHSSRSMGILNWLYFRRRSNVTSVCQRDAFHFTANDRSSVFIDAS